MIWVIGAVIYLVIVAVGIVFADRWLPWSDE